MASPSISGPAAKGGAAAAAAEAAAAVKFTWDKFGLEQPFWSVLTNPGYKGTAAEVSAGARAAFYRETGKCMDLLVAALAKPLWSGARVLDYGCGVGRMTRAVAEQLGVREVVGVDISAPHLALAERYGAVPGRTHYVHIDPDMPHFLAPAVAAGAPGLFDVAFCLIVLQHNRPPMIAACMTEILAAVRPGGLALLHVPVFHPHYHHAGARPAAPGVMEMHCMRLGAAMELIRRCGGVLEGAIEASMCGPDFHDLVLVVRKAPAAA